MKKFNTKVAICIFFVALMVDGLVIKYSSELSSGGLLHGLIFTFYAAAITPGFILFAALARLVGADHTTSSIFTFNSWIPLSALLGAIFWAILFGFILRKNNN